MSVDIRLLTVDELKDAAQELFVQHRDEIATMPDIMEVNPLFDAYYQAEEKGGLFILGGVDGGSVAAYSVNFIAPNLHYSALYCTTNDLLFVAKGYRNSRLGLRLMRETEDEARRRGCALMLWHAKPNSTLSAICQRPGYGVQDIIYHKRLV